MLCGDSQWEHRPILAKTARLLRLDLHKSVASPRIVAIAASHNRGSSSSDRFLGNTRNDHCCKPAPSPRRLNRQSPIVQMQCHPPVARLSTIFGAPNGRVRGHACPLGGVSHCTLRLLSAVAYRLVNKLSGLVDVPCPQFSSRACVILWRGARASPFALGISASCGTESS